MRLLGKCRERRGAASNRRALRKMTGDDERRLLCAADNSALSAVRRATGHDELSAVERAQKARPSKKRLWRNVSAPDLIPARKKLIGMKRRVFERCKRVGHSMIAMDEDGVAVPWTYVRGSGLSGVRLYEAENGMGKRLACHSHKQPKGAVAGTHEDSLAASASHPANEFWANDELPDPTVRPLSLAEKTVLKSSTLDNADGTGAEVIVAVEFDIAEATASSIASRTKRCTVEDLLNDQQHGRWARKAGLHRELLLPFSLSICRKVGWSPPGQKFFLYSTFLAANITYTLSWARDSNSS